jgi:hypothetical protein
MTPSIPGTTTEAGPAFAEPSPQALTASLDLQADERLDPALEPAIRLHEPAAIVASPAVASTGSIGAPLPLSFLRHLLGQLGELNLSHLSDLLPALRILAIALTAGLALRITGAVLGSLNDLPLLGNLLELVGLIQFVQLISRHALKHQKRAELLARIQELKRQLLG